MHFRAPEQGRGLDFCLGEISSSSGEKGLPQVGTLLEGGPRTVVGGPWGALVLGGGQQVNSADAWQAHRGGLGKQGIWALVPCNVQRNDIEDHDWPLQWQAMGVVSVLDTTVEQSRISDRQR